MNSIDSLAAHLRKNGEIAVIPTDTVYGVVGRASDIKSVERLYELKRRENKPGTLVAFDIEQLVALGVERAHLEAVEKFWPGPVSVIVPCGANLEYLHQGKGSLAIRIPSNEWLRTLLKETGPLITSSANQPGEPPATTVDEAKRYFGDKVTWYEDHGTIDRDPSTIIRVVEGNIEVVRQGAVIIKQGE
jgi:L-threonylcarbamoyladenylate synthase